MVPSISGGTKSQKQLENDSARIANETTRLANDKARDAENAKVTAMVMAQNQQLMKSNQELARSNQQMTSQFMSFTTMVMDRLNQGQAIQASRPTAIPEISYVVHPMCDPSSSQDEFQGFHTQKWKSNLSEYQSKDSLFNHIVIIIVKIWDLVKKLNFF